MPRSAKKNETKLLSALAVAEENERENIARHIHSVNTLLSLVKINMKKAARHASNKKMFEQVAKENYAVLDESMRTISHYVRELSPPLFSRIGYMSAMDELCRRMNADCGKSIRWQVMQAKTKLTPQSELQLYRLSKELLECFLREAGANDIQITWNEKGKKRLLRFTHDGNDIGVCAGTRYSIEARALLAGVQLHCGRQWVEIQMGHGKNH